MECLPQFFYDFQDRAYEETLPCGSKKTIIQFIKHLWSLRDVKNVIFGLIKSLRHSH